jgi:hypothetical protein
VNTATATCSPDGFPNILTASDGHTSDVLHPTFTLTKVCKVNTQPIPQEGPAIFTVTFTNTGDADLNVASAEGGNYSVPVGGSHTYDVNVAGPFSGQATVSNTESVTVTLDARYQLANTYTATATGTCDVGGRINLLKLTDGVEHPTMQWTFKVYDGPNGFGGTAIATDTAPPALLDFGNVNLDPTKTYTVCEENVPAGWTSMWMIDTDNDGVADTIVPAYNPNATDNPPQDLGNRCFEFGAGTSYPIPAGGTLVFKVDNSFPGGDPRTPGYWKNWSSCTNGGQYAHSVEAGGGAAGFWSLDELLNDPGFTIGDLVLGAGDCADAVNILDKSDLNGKKKASDAAYNLATALLAAKLNFAAGAATCQAAQDAAMAAQQLLDNINFTGTGDYLTSKAKGPAATQRNLANQLAAILDQYNNGNLC